MYFSLLRVKQCLLPFFRSFCISFSTPCLPLLLQGPSVVRPPCSLFINTHICTHTQTHHPSDRGRHCWDEDSSLHSGQQGSELINQSHRGGGGMLMVETQGREVKGKCITHLLILKRDLLYCFQPAKCPKICNSFLIFCRSLHWKNTDLINVLLFYIHVQREYLMIQRAKACSQPGS